jgi:hypothetical protein
VYNGNAEIPFKSMEKFLHDSCETPEERGDR